MKRLRMWVATCASCWIAVSVLRPAYGAPPFEVPAWLFPISPPSSPAASTPPASEALLHVPGSRAAFTRAQVTDLFAPPDWFPDRHSPMPEVVAHGRRPSVYACGFCHLPDGRGRPENATLAGLPAEYIVRQLEDFASQARRTAWTGTPYKPTSLMEQVAQAATDAESAEAAAYFAAQRLREPRAEVIEAERIPAMHIQAWLYVQDADGHDETLGQRIVETPRDFGRHELRDPATEYVAYVPPGSIERGRRLATTGSEDRTLPCAGCHGPDLRGAGVIPPIAGRSPTYLLRQLVAFRTGARDAPTGQPMQLVVARLELGDMIALAAYVGSRPP